MRILHIFAALSFFLSCDNDVSREEMWREKETLADGSCVIIFHDYDCKDNRPLFLCKDKKIYYSKYKNHVFDYCFNDEELKLLTAISRYNIKDYLDNAPKYFEEDSEWDYYKKNKLILDKTPCSHCVRYSIINNKPIKLKDGIDSLFLFYHRYK